MSLKTQNYSKIIILTVIILNILSISNLITFTINNANAVEGSVCKLCVYQGGDYLECTTSEYGWTACIHGPHHCEHTGTNCLYE